MTRSTRSKAGPKGRRQFLDASWKAVSALAVSGLLPAPADAQPANVRFAGLKVLILFHSRTGHTRTIANQIHEVAGGDLVEIETEEPYSADYDAVVSQNAEEQRTGYLPPLRTAIENIRAYDLIFIGSPLWNVRLTPPVRSLLASHDLSGKTIAPFVTYIVSGLGRSRRDIGELCPDATVLPGLAVLGEEAGQAERKVQAWLEALPVARAD